MEGPSSAKQYDAAFMTDTVTNEHTITMMVGAPRAAVSRSAGSRRFTRGRRRMPLRLSAGIWMSICAATPKGLPMAMM